MTRYDNYELYHVVATPGPRDGKSICCVVATSDLAVRIIINLFSFLYRLFNCIVNPTNAS
jgi:hypothetical protein